MFKPLAWLAFLAILGLAETAFPETAHANHRQAATERLVHWAGCKAPVVTSDERSVLESFYDLGHTLYVGTDHDVPYGVWLIVLFHETAHCLQYQELGQAMEYSYAVDPMAFELDADRHAATLVCGLGLDGPGFLHDAFVWILKVYGYDGDENHGTLAQRIHAGDNACMAPTPLQAPLRHAL